MSRTNNQPNNNNKSNQTCALCRATGTTLSLCSRCKRVWYCNSVCQKAHWKKHKKICEQGCTGSAGSAAPSPLSLLDILLTNNIHMLLDTVKSRNATTMTVGISWHDIPSTMYQKALEYFEYTEENIQLPLLLAAIVLECDINIVTYILSITSDVDKHVVTKSGDIILSLLHLALLSKVPGVAESVIAALDRRNAANTTVAISWCDIPTGLCKGALSDFEYTIKKIQLPLLTVAIVLECGINIVTYILSLNPDVDKGVVTESSDRIMSSLYFAFLSVVPGVTDAVISTVQNTSGDHTLYDDTIWNVVNPYNPLLTNKIVLKAMIKHNFILPDTTLRVPNKSDKRCVTMSVLYAALFGGITQQDLFTALLDEDENCAQILCNNGWHVISAIPKDQSHNNVIKKNITSGNYAVQVYIKTEALRRERAPTVAEIQTSPKIVDDANEDDADKDDADKDDSDEDDADKDESDKDESDEDDADKDESD